MKTTITLNKQEIAQAVAEAMRAKGWTVTSHAFNVTATADYMDRPTGNAVTLDLVVEERKGDPQR